MSPKIRSYGSEGLYLVRKERIMSARELHDSKTWAGRLSVVFALMILMICCIPAFAAGKIKKTGYKGDGRIEVEFAVKVSYDNAVVTVSDSKGESVKAAIVEMDEDDLEFVIDKVQLGETYSFTIDGVIVGKDKESSQLAGEITIPTWSGVVPVREVSYDENSHQVEIEFDTRVEWETPTVVITSGAYNMVTGIDEFEDSEIEVSVEELTKGVTYKYTINGVRKRNSKEPFGSVTGTFSY